MDNELKMVISRGKVTFSRTTSTRCSTWSLLAGDSTDKILDVLTDVVQELRPHDVAVLSQWDEKYAQETQPEDDIPVSDGVAFQPPKTTVLGGEVFLGNSEPTPR